MFLKGVKVDLRQIDDEKLITIAERLKQYGFDKLNDGILKSDSPSIVYKKAFGAAICDLFAKVDDKNLVYVGSRSSIKVEDIIVGARYWCMLDIGTSVYSRANESTLKYSGIRACRIVGISEDRKTALVLPQSHKSIDNNVKEVSYTPSIQFVSVEQISTRLEGDDYINASEQAREYFSKVIDKTGYGVKFKAKDYAIKPLKTGVVEERIYRPSFGEWEKEIDSKKLRDNYPLLQEFEKTFTDDVNLVCSDPSVQSRLAPYKTLIAYITFNSEISRYVKDFNNLFNELYSAYEDMKKDDENKTTLSAEQFNVLFGMIDTYFKTAFQMFISSSHGISINSDVLKSPKDIEIMVGGIYENVYLGLSIANENRPSGFKDVMVAGINPETQDLICYAVENGEIIDFPMVLKPINFMGENVKFKSAKRVDGQIEELIENGYLSHENDIETIKNFPIFKGNLRNNWNYDFKDKYVAFLFEQHTKAHVSKVLRKHKGNYYCALVDNDLGNDKRRFVTFVESNGSIKIGDNYPFLLTFGHLKNRLYHGDCGVEEAINVAVKNVRYKGINKTGLCLEYLKAMDIEIRGDEETCLNLISELIDGYVRKKEIDMALVEALSEKLEYVGNKTSNEWEKYL